MVQSLLPSLQLSSCQLHETKVVIGSGRKLPLACTCPHKVDFTRSKSTPGTMTVTRFHLLFLLLLLALAVPFATADTIQLTNNNLGLAGIIGNVNLTQGAGGVNVTLSAGSGFSFKTQRGDILFNTNVNLTASNISQIKINGV